LVLKLAQEYGVTQLNFFGDSKMVIQWMHKEIALISFTIWLMYDEVINPMTSFSYTSLSHIYRDNNSVVDGLSKVGVGLEWGTYIVSII
jgi:hypothetical protein